MFNPPQQPAQQAPNLGQEVVAMQRRLKMTEESLANLRRQEQLNEQNTIAINKRVTTQLKEFEHEIGELRKAMDKLKDDVRLIISELQATAKSENVVRIEKQLNMLNPIHFVTQQEIDSIVDDRIRKWKQTSQQQ